MAWLNEERVRSLSKDLYHIALLLILIILLLGVISWIFGCNAIPIPGWCDVYWGIMRWATGGQPTILIVYGDGGLGNHELLRDSLADPKHLGVRANSLQLKRISIGELKRYDLVIVEEARLMSTEKMKVFIDYLSSGGRLVWTGDAGTELEKGDEYLRDIERGTDDKNVFIGPWARKDGSKMVLLDEFIGVNYLTNYCTAKSCKQGEAPWIGTFMPINSDHTLIYGMRPDLQMFGDFSIVDVSDDAYTNRILDVDFGSDLIAKDGKNLGKSFPIIVATGLGERALYYSIPPEMFLSDEMPASGKGGCSNEYVGGCTKPEGFCGNGIADAGEQCNEPGLDCSGGEGCVNCVCVKLECSNNSDCDDANPCTQDFCQGAGEKVQYWSFLENLYRASLK